MPTDLFLFAHQDDEFGVFQLIRESLAKGNLVECVYLTNGDGGVALPSERNKESLKVLSGLGVEENNIHFLGTELEVPDGQLRHHLKRVLHVLSIKAENADMVYSHAWEGGHIDHDACFILLRQLVHDRQVPVTRTRTFALYNSEGMFGPFFKVFAPIADHGSIEKSPIKWSDRLRDIWRCCQYPSQWKSWVGLLPFVVLHYLFRGYQSIQSMPEADILQRPHSGALLYEKRGPVTYTQFIKDIEEQLDTRINLRV